MKTTFSPLPAEQLRSLPSPTVTRRIALYLYELLVLLGVSALTFLIPHLLIGIYFQITLPAVVLLAHLYLILAMYFTWYWTKTGQTLAMQTWKIQVVTRDGKIMNKPQALMRFAYGSLWILPASLCLFVMMKSALPITLGTGLSIVFFFFTILFWPLTALLDRQDKQMIQDRLAKTRMVQLPRNVSHPVSRREE